MGWDDMFDFNGDGSIDLGEALIGYKVVNDALDNLRGDADLYDEDDDWRDFCEDGSDYDLDPQDFSSEEEYEKALEQAREAWKAPYRDNPPMGVDPDLYDTEDEYLEAVEDAQDEWREECDDLFRESFTPDDFESKEDYVAALEETIRTAKEAWNTDDQAAADIRGESPDFQREMADIPLPEIPPQVPVEPAPDPLQPDTREGVSSLCGVLFDGTGHPYSYLTGGLFVRVGDKVVVPVGEKGKETIAEVVWVAQSRRDYAPYPASVTKAICKRFTPPSCRVVCPILGREVTPEECYEAAGTECCHPMPLIYTHALNGTPYCPGYPRR